MRNTKRFLQEKTKLFGLITTLCLCCALLVYGGIRLFAVISDDARVDENQELTYYITVNSDGIDQTGVKSSDSVTVDEVSGITTVTDILPDGLTFEGFVTSSDGTFGAVQRDDQVTQCAGHVIDDTNEESVDEGVWTAGNTEYTYHGLHYDANTRTVTFRTKGIGAGCELTVGVITRTPTLPEGVYRMDFYDHATFVDESLIGDSNEVHAWIQKPVLPGEFSLSYEYRGNVPANAPDLPATTYYDTKNASITVAPVPTLDGYTFDGWKYLTTGGEQNGNNLTQLPGYSVVLYGSWSTDGGDPVPVTTPSKYNVTYEVEGEKPLRFKTPARRSYYEGASVAVDSTNSEGDNVDGYNFSGWDTNDVTVDDDDNFTMPSRNVTLRGSFEQDTYTLSYEFIGDVVPAGVSVPASETHHAGDQITVANAPQADGYTFHGWYADATFEMPARDAVIQGEWVKNKIEFTPEIEIEITNPEDEYRKGDTVDFKVTVTNDETFPLNNVWLQELLDGAVFIEGDGYEISEDNSFAKITEIPARSSAVVYAKYPVTKNIDKIWTNVVEIVSLDSGDDDYVLSDDWENTASVDFKTVAVPDEPIDEDDEPEKEEENAKTYDGLGKIIISGVILGGGLAACIVLVKRVRRDRIIYGYCAVIMSVAGLSVVIINGGLSFADILTEKPEVKIYSSELSFENAEPGSWNVWERARWTGAGEATLDIDVSTVKISDLHNKDVVLMLDNSSWTQYSINGTLVTSESVKPAMQILKEGALEFVDELLDNGDSRVIIMPTWGNNDAVLTSDIEVANSQITSIETSSNTNYYAYSTAYDKVLNFVDNYQQSDDRSLNIIFVSDDHKANSDEIAQYKMLKAKAPKATVSGIGMGIMEILNERYTSAESARANGVYVFWEGEDNPASTGPFYRASGGLDKLADQQENPWASDYVASLKKAADTSLPYSKFNVSTTIDTTIFDIKYVEGTTGKVEVNEGTITWKNEEERNRFISGSHYKLSVILQAKDNTVELHKLYKLNNGTTVDTDASDIEADNVTSSEAVVLKNGYQLTFDDNNAETCNLGDNRSGVYWAFQEINLDEDGVSCDGWNFDSFKDPADGTIYSNSLNSKMPADDLTLKATWRSVGAEVHMDGQIHTVAPAILMNGPDYNAKMYEIENYNSYALLRAEGCPATRMQQSNEISDPYSPTKIYAWRSDYGSYPYMNKETGYSPYSYSYIIWYCTDADTIVLNENSMGMFANSTYYDENNNSHYFNSHAEIIDEDIANWDASRVRDMTAMFYDSNLGTVTYNRIGDWNTTSVEDMDYAFARAEISQDMENELNWDTSSVTSMRHVFDGSDIWSTDNKFLKHVKGVEDWDVSQVTDMSYAFYGAGDNLPALEDWNVVNVTNMEGTFKSMGNDFSSVSEWDTSNVTNMKETFSGAQIDDLSALSRWDTSSVETFESTFENANVKTDNVDGDYSPICDWNLSSAKTAKNMFRKSGITDLTDLSGWGETTGNIENFDGMFVDNVLTSLDGLEHWDTSSATSMSYTFADKNTNTSTSYGTVNANVRLTDLLGVRGWDVSNVTNMEGIFAGANPDDLRALSGWNVGNVENMSKAFCGAFQKFSDTNRECDDTNTDINNGKARGNYGGPKTLVGIENWDTSKVKNMSAIFAGGEVRDLSPINNWNLSSLEDLSKAFMWLDVQDFKGINRWNTSNVKNLSYTFAYSKATSLAGLDGINGTDIPGQDSHRWDVSNVTTMNSMLRGMLSLTDISALSGWQTSSLTDMERFLEDHKVLTSLNGLQNWNISNVGSLHSAFKGYALYANTGTIPTRNNNTAYFGWTDGCGSALTDISALSGWDVSNMGSSATFYATFACNTRLANIDALSGWRVHKAKSFTHMFEKDTSITSLQPLAHWFDDADSLETENKAVSFNSTFANMTSLNDISALANWTSSKIWVSEMHSFMRMDGNIPSGDTKTYLQNTFFKEAPYGSIWPRYAKDYAFTGVDGNKPTWWNPTYQ